LALSLCREKERLVKVAYFSAHATWRPSAYARHRAYVAALQQIGVECHLARFSEKAARCNTCGATWKQHEEKETDVHFSLTLVEDAIDNVFDRAILISADSDLVPAVRVVRKRLPKKEVFVATPPGRHSYARDLLGSCHSGTSITQGRIARCLLPARLEDARGVVWLPKGLLNMNRPPETCLHCDRPRIRDRPLRRAASRLHRVQSLELAR
jgi:hypothetical protein